MDGSMRAYQNIFKVLPRFLHVTTDACIFYVAMFCELSSTNFSRKKKKNGNRLSIMCRNNIPHLRAERKVHGK